MKIIRMLPIFLALALAAAGGSALAQNAGTAATAAAAAVPVTRAQVKIDTAEFRRTHRWDVMSENWVLRDEFEAPVGVKSRAEVRAETVAFLRLNRWDEATDSWIALKTKPREMSTLAFDATVKCVGGLK